MNRELILEVAAQIIRQKGFHATSMQDIADAVNLQKASLYHHISNKQDILLALLDQALDLLTERIIMVVELNQPSDVKLQLAIESFLEIIMDRSDLVSVLLLEHRSLDEEYHDSHIAKRDRYERIWRDLIQEGIDTGKFEKIDPVLTARAILGVMNWTVTWYRPGGTLGIKTVIDHLSKVYLYGLIPRSVKNVN